MIDYNNRRKQMPFTRYVVLTIALTLASLKSVLAAGIELHGTLRGAGDTPKAFASVQLEGAKRYAAVTGIDGNFVITNFVPGSYLVHIRKKDDVETRTVTISSSPLTLSVKW
jgi:hypothetical protein